MGLAVVKALRPPRVKVVRRARLNMVNYRCLNLGIAKGKQVLPVEMLKGEFGEDLKDRDLDYLSDCSYLYSSLSRHGT